MPTKSLFKLAEEAEKQQALATGQQAAVGQQGVMQFLQPPRETRVRLKWDDRLAQLKAFQAKHGHIDVPRSYAKDPSLGTFVCNQRQTYKRMNEGKGPSMDRSRVQQLNELGFKWALKHKDQPVIVDSDDEGFEDGTKSPYIRSVKPKPLSWECGIEQLKEFQILNGHSDVPHIFAANQPLGNFVKSIRQNFKNMQKGKSTKLLNEPRILELQMMGFKLQVRQREPWEQRFQELRQYAMQHGNCEVPKHTPLGIWILNQRSQFKLMLKKKPSHMSEERINLLNSIGFDWRVPMQNSMPLPGQVYVYGGHAYGATAASALLPSDGTYAPPAISSIASMPSDAAFASALASEHASSMPDISDVPLKTEELDDESSVEVIQDTASDAHSFEQVEYQVADSAAAYGNLATASNLDSFVQPPQEYAPKPSPSARRVSEDSTSNEAANHSAIVPNNLGTSYPYMVHGLMAQPSYHAQALPGFDFRKGTFGDGSIMPNLSFQHFSQAPAPSGNPAELPTFAPDAFVQSLLNEDFSVSSSDEEILQI